MIKMALKNELYFSQRNKYLLVIVLTLLPIASMMLIVFFTSFSPVFIRMEKIVEEDLNIVQPIHHLQVSVLESVMPPNDYLIHGQDFEKKHWKRSKAAVDQAFEQVLSKLEHTWEHDKIQKLKGLWRTSKAQGDMLFQVSKPAQIDQIAIDAMEQFDQDVYKLSNSIKELTFEKVKSMQERYESIETLKTWSISFTISAILLGMVLGVLGSIWLSRDRKKMVGMSMHDALTGIYNRRTLDMELERLQKNRVKFSPPCFAVLMLDIDKFKGVNDRYGHDAGDAVLKTFTRVISKMIRNGDIFGRFGGEEFLLLLPQTNRAEAALMAERIRQGIESAAFELPDDAGSIRVTASIGVSVYSDEVATIEQALKNADEALYEAKETGRNKVVCA